MKTKEEVSKNKSVNPIQTQIQYREWSKRRGLRAYNKPETTPPGGKKNPNKQLLFSGRNGNAS
jgi:hypothetical protein